MTTEAALLEVRGLTKSYGNAKSFFGQKLTQVHALAGVSFSVSRGETLSIVGESGCGKSTLGRAILQIAGPTGGDVILEGRNLGSLSVVEMREMRQKLQVVFQDPFSSMNPRMRVSEIIGEPLKNFGLAEGSARDAEIGRLLELVNLPQASATRFPHEFSGGQRQRICIARALATRPDLIICDEAVSALDVSVKAQIINLLVRLQKELGLALLFISHDLAVVEHLSHRVAVMYLGRIVEIADRAALFSSPLHPYTRALLSSVPVPDPTLKRERIVMRGELPSSMNPPSGCKFHTRCPLAFDRCRTEEPMPLPVGAGGHLVACHLHVGEFGHAAGQGAGDAIRQE